MSEQEVYVYTQHHCPACEKVKSFLEQQGVSFVERNIVEDDNAMDELEAMGILSVPITVRGEDVVIGYDRKRLEKLTA
jgi:glutaredoxin